MTSSNIAHTAFCIPSSLKGHRKRATTRQTNVRVPHHFTPLYGHENGPLSYYITSIVMVVLVRL